MFYFNKFCVISLSYFRWFKWWVINGQELAFFFQSIEVPLLTYILKCIRILKLKFHWVSKVLRNNFHINWLRIIPSLACPFLCDLLYSFTEFYSLPPFPCFRSQPRGWSFIRWRRSRILLVVSLASSAEAGFLLCILRNVVNISKTLECSSRI